MMLQHRPYLGKINHVQIINPENAMGIAHIHHRRRMDERVINGANLQLDMACVVERFRQRNILPVKPWHTIINCHQLVASLARRQKPAERVDGSGGRLVLIE